MLVLSRQADQAIVINERLILAVESVGRETVRLSLKNLRGVPLGKWRLGRKESALLPPDGQVTVVEIKPEKVRLGLQFKGNVRIDRRENWDSLGPNW